ncbi:MAG: hypothetical protein N2255_00135 [Kiritimatiellae bacterium]|nr:hypothetical protein [Kiritimatiellia bacterium]
MSQRVTGTFNGTGADVYICVGFVPDFVRLWALEDSDVGHRIWLRAFRAAEVTKGIEFVGSSGALQVDALASADGGIEPYEGGEILTSLNQTSTAYGEGVYLGPDGTDYRQDPNYGYALKVIDTWYLDNSSNRTGHVNANTVASGCRIGEGSVIRIRERSTGLVKEAVVESWTAGAGATANDVRLSRAIGSGEILYIGGMYSFAPLPLGVITPPGFKITKHTVCNVNDEIQAFEAMLD